MTERERHLDRLVKLLALERSANVHEAESARRAAERLMGRCGLTREEAESRGAGSHHVHPMGTSGWMATWRLVLLTAAARYCGAEVLVMACGRGRRVSVAGRREDVEEAVALYGRLSRAVADLESWAAWQLEDARVMGDVRSLQYLEDLDELGSRRCSDSFRRGATWAVVQQLTEAGGRSLFDDVAPRTPDPSEGILTVAEVAPPGEEKVVSAPLALDDADSRSWFALGAEAAREVLVVEGSEVSCRFEQTERQGAEASPGRKVAQDG